MEMKRLGDIVRNIQSDRGSEYLNQEGNAPEERARIILNLGKFARNLISGMLLDLSNKRRSELKYFLEIISKLLMQFFGKLDLFQHFGCRLHLIFNVCGTGLRTLTRGCPRRAKCSLAVKQIGVR
jgi:hypothetical protein